MASCTKLAGIVVICSFSALAPSMVLADAPSILTMTQILRNAKVVNADRSLRLSIGNKTVLIATARGAKSTDKDCCIDAVLLAKTLIDAYPDEINRVKVMFSKSGSDTFTQVNVTTGDVKAFGSGQISEDQLLSSLDVQEVSAASTGAGDEGTTAVTNLVPGPFIEKRLLLLQQIDDMEKKGTGVKPFRDLFDKVEADIKKGDQATALSDIQYLAQKLGEEEKVLKDLSSPRPRMPSASGASPGSLAATSAGRLSAQDSSLGGTGGRGGSSDSASSADLVKRCDDYIAKIRKLQSQGQDVTQLLDHMNTIRGFSGDPKNYERAKHMLDAMDGIF